jgi:hypothetical protein
MPGASTSPVRLADWVASRPEGARNGGLFWAACRMVEHGFDYDTAIDALRPAAVHIGLRDQLIDRTIRSAFRQTSPREPVSAEPSPERPSADRPMASVTRLRPGGSRRRPTQEVNRL